MDWKDLSEPAKRAHSNIRGAFTSLLDAALDQITGVEGVRELQPRAFEVGELLASGEATLGKAGVTITGKEASERVAAAIHRWAEAFPCVEHSGAVDILGELLRNAEECPTRAVGEVWADILEKIDRGNGPSFANREAIRAGAAAGVRLNKAAKKSKARKAKDK